VAVEAELDAELAELAALVSDEAALVALVLACEALSKLYSQSLLR
jgi:hypothetical protein